MKSRKKIIISTLALVATLLTVVVIKNACVLDHLEGDYNIKITKEVIKDSVEVSKLKENFESYKQKELAALDKKYTLNQGSNIDTVHYSNSELLDLQAKYPEASTLGEALASQNEQNHKDEVLKLEKSIENKLEQSILDNKYPIYMPDEALKQAVITTLELNVDELYAENLYQITELDLSNLEINNLEGLEYAINLEKLDLSNSTIDNPITLKPLGMLGKLKEINLLGIFRFTYEGGLNYLPASVEKAYVEDFWNTEDFNFETSAENENIKTGGD